MTVDVAERWFTVVNPAAGGGRCGRRAPDALAKLREGGLVLDAHDTSGPGQATELVRAAWADGYRRFLGVGGDGTGYEIVNGLFPRQGDEVPRLALLPLGTGNSFLRDFAITSADIAMRAILRGETHTCDVVRATHADGELHFINLLSLGFSAEAGALTNRRFKPFGVPGYVIAVLTTAARLQSPVFPIRVDGGDLDERPCVLLSFSNSRYTAGTMMMAPHADPTDGALDVIRISAMGRAPFVRSFPSIFRGKHVLHPKVEETRAKTIDLDLASPVDVMVDGEVLELALRRLEVIPGAVEVVA
ncbi:MAG: diacylglycerol kinase family lipid kinase [Sandaracinaceae bacterium]|nr:diacylglycerol kinase family lipid kinase [Sandaracinaceae bacterium]